MRHHYDAPIGEPGPFTTDQIREGSRYELSDGHPIYCAPAGGRHAVGNSQVAQMLGADPDAVEVGVDSGYAINERTLRAPDVAVGNVPNIPGWIPGAPGLAVEIADRGQDEADLQDKIRDFLGAGTKYVWVVRMHGPRRVEVYGPGDRFQVFTAGESLTAPGLLARPVPVESFYDADAAHEVALGNLLARKGYASLEAVRDEGSAQAARDMLLRLVASKGWTLTPAQRARLAAADPAQITACFEQALTATDPADLIV